MCVCVCVCVCGITFEINNQLKTDHMKDLMS